MSDRELVRRRIAELGPWFHNMRLDARIPPSNRSDDGLRRLAHRGHDAVVGAAATEVAGHIFADFRIRSRMALTDAGDCRHDLARRAIAALESVLLQEGSLNRVQGSVGPGQSFDRFYLTAFDLGRQGETG